MNIKQEQTPQAGQSGQSGHPSLYRRHSQQSTGTVEIHDNIGHDLETPGLPNDNSNNSRTSGSRVRDQYHAERVSERYPSTHLSAQFSDKASERRISQVLEAVHLTEFDQDALKLVSINYEAKSETDTSADQSDGDSLSGSMTPSDEVIKIQKPAVIKLLDTDHSDCLESESTDSE